MLEQSPNVIDREAVDAFKKDLKKGCSELDYGDLLHQEVHQLAVTSLPDGKHRHLYRIVPLMSGTKIQMWLKQYHELSITFSSASEAPLNVAHLYNATKQYDKLPTTLQ
jgi:hypothetical protein